MRPHSFVASPSAIGSTPVASGSSVPPCPTFVLGSPASRRIRLTALTAVSAVKRILREAGEPKTKVGHGGTLDPLATGVLPIALGEATKLVGRVLGAAKGFELH